MVEGGKTALSYLAGNMLKFTRWEGKRHVGMVVITDYAKRYTDFSLSWV